MAKIPSDHFRTFAYKLSRVLKQVATTDGQKRQIDDLVGLERSFRAELCSHPAGKRVYARFLAYILDERKNILNARPFFRERQKSFSVKISPALKSKDIETLQTFGFNYAFVKFALKVYRGSRRKALQAIANQISEHRNALISRNLPLAISQAKRFWGKIPKNGAREHMDFVQLCAEGLISAIDKFVPPYRTVWRSVAIGRMVGNMTEASSDTLMHYYPSDKRLLYKANLLIHRKKMESLAEVVEAINATKKSVIRATRRRVDTGLEIWVKEVDKNGVVVDPRHRIDVTFMGDPIRECFYDKKVGSVVTLPGYRNTVFEIIEIYEIVTETRLLGLLKGSSHLSMDTAILSGASYVDPENAGMEMTNVHSKMADTAPSPEYSLIQNDLCSKMQDAFFTDLTILERKVLVLKGAYCETDG